ncbi:MAG: hypothetical protein ACLQGU_12700 [bacterium]
MYGLGPFFQIGSTVSETDSTMNAAARLAPPRARYRGFFLLVSNGSSDAVHDFMVVVVHLYHEEFFVVNDSLR